MIFASCPTKIVQLMFTTLKFQAAQYKVRFKPDKKNHNLLFLLILQIYAASFTFMLTRSLKFKVVRIFTD